MFTRRRMLEQTLALPLLPIGMSVVMPQVISEDNYLSRESADGFRQVLTRRAVANCPIIILAGATRPLSPISANLHSFMRRGGWVICEPAPRAFPEPNRFARELYVRYSWPVETLVRSFGHPTAVPCSPQEVIASFNGDPVAYRQNFGTGGCIHLGSMLGPHLRAGDREARELALALLTASTVLV